MVAKNGDQLGAVAVGLTRARLQICATDFAGARQVVESALPLVTPILQLRRDAARTSVDPQSTLLAQAMPVEHERAKAKALDASDACGHERSRTG